MKKLGSKVVVLVVLTVIFIAVIVPQALAAEGLEVTTEIMQDNGQETAKSVIGGAEEKKSVLGSKRTMEQLFKIVNYHINNYLKTNYLDLKNKIIVPSNNIISLYDLDNNIIAYMIPLIDKETQSELGYITVGATEKSSNAYEINLNTDLLQKIRIILSNNETNNPKVIFAPPIGYTVQRTNNETNTLEFVDIISNKVVESQKILKNTQNIYDKFYNEENKINTLKILDQEESIVQTASFQKGYTVRSLASLYSVEDYRLQSEYLNPPEFLKIDGSFYGGDQGWWNSINPTKAERGCGPVAAANITCYMARSNPSKYGRMYTGSLTKSTFLAHMDSLYNALSPSIIGCTDAREWADKVSSWARTKGVYIVPEIKNWSFTLDNCANYIKEGLSKDLPVASLSLNYFADYGWHWMTITKYFQDANNNKFIACSTWGERRSIDFTAYFNSIKVAINNTSIGGAFIYFNDELAPNFNTSKYYRIVSKSTGKVLDLYGGSDTNWLNKMVINYPWHGGDNQWWKIEKQSDGYYKISCKRTGGVLDVYGGTIQEWVGLATILYPWHEGNNQRWHLEKQSDNSFKFVIKSSGKVCDVYMGSNSAWYNLATCVWSWHGGDSQKWYIEELN
jgi:hypothetical protein